MVGHMSQQVMDWMKWYSIRDKPKTQYVNNKEAEKWSKKKQK
jgi:hypothetical protein